MSKVSRKAWIGGAIVACVVLAAAAGVAMLLDANQHKSSIESAVSASLGLQFKIEGKASLHLFPHTYLTLENVHLSDGKTERLSAVSVQASPRWIPFIFHRKLSLESLSLDHPTMRVERNAVEASAAPDSVSGPGTMALISIRRGDITFVDRSSASTVTAGNLDLTLSGITWSRSVPGQPFIVLKSLSLHGTLHAATLAIGDFKASNVQCQVTDEAGLLRLDSTDMVVFGGVSRGSLTIDLRGASPHLRLVQAASGIDLPKIFPVQIFVGKAQASLDIVGTGYDQRAIVPTMQGKVAIRSDHVTINSLDIDRLIADYERTQNFNLIDLASFVIVGPFAPLLTKGVDFSRLSFFGRLGNAKSEIRRVVSDWTIVGGVATATDVAFTTPKNTVAFRGDLDLADGTYHKFFVATVDQHGCTRVKRQISGHLTHPNAEGPVEAGLGPFKSAVRTTVRLFQSHPCDHFYSGSAIN